MKSFLNTLGIAIPVIQAGMVWCSGHKLAKAVSKSGALGCIGAGSMPPEILDIHLSKMAAENLTFAVNLPLFYSRIDEQIELVKKYKVPIVISSAGSPSKYTEALQSSGIKVMHVVSSLKFALKAQAAGADAVIAEGFEAGGHNGRDENTTWVLAELLKDSLSIPFFLAGGMFSGASLAAAKCFGAEGIQVGSRFAVCKESSAHDIFKDVVMNAKEGDTELTLKELMPVRLLKTAFYEKIQRAQENNLSVEMLRELLGKGRSKKGIFEGNLEEGELEIGQISAKINKIESAETIVKSIVSEYTELVKTNLTVL